MSTDQPTAEEAALARVVGVDTETELHHGGETTIATADSGGVQVAVQLTDAADAAQVAAATADAEHEALTALGESLDAASNGGDDPCNE